MTINLKLLVNILCISVISNFISQEPNSKSEFMNPIGISVYDKLLGQIGNHIVYEDIDIDGTVPKNLPKQDKIPYLDLLKSGIKSMLFEYKNYGGEVISASYVVFGLGNYNSISPIILKALNKHVLTNQKLLDVLYNWVRPHYENIFKDLTIEEQELLLSKVTLADKYINYVVKENNKSAFEKWLNDSGIKYDDKVIGFLKRRIDKKQWSIADCEKWINQINKDFNKLLKDGSNISSHYQVVKIINSKLLIACNHNGGYFIMNHNFEKKIDNEYKLILNNESGVIEAYSSLDQFDYTRYYIDDFEELIVPPDQNWTEWYELTSETFFASKINQNENEDSYGQIISGVYDENGNEIMSTVGNVFFFNDIDLFVSQELNNFYVYNYFGKRIFENPIAYDVLINSSGEDSLYYDPSSDTFKSLYSFFYEPINENKWIIIEDNKGNAGLYTTDGIEILPFEYTNIIYLPETNRIMADKLGETKSITFIIENDKLIQIE
jgi:hypothetical protein